MYNGNFFVFALIFLAAFLFLPKISLAVELDNIELKTLGKYLALPENRVQELIHSLIGIFEDEFEEIMTTRQYSPPYPTPEEMAVPSIMKKVVQVQALNHLLTDVPFQITWGIVNNSIKIARLIVVKDIRAILDELEKESVKKATEYGIKFLLENEIKVSPGAMSFEYTSKKGNKEEALFQYVMVYKPINTTRADVLIRFYSPNTLEQPKNETSYGGIYGVYTELNNNVSPFIVNVRGMVEDYRWIGKPSIEIAFPAEVPDLGIRPLSFWERNILQPITANIKNVEVIITRIIGNEPQKLAEDLVEKLFGITNDIWGTIKSVISQINLFGGAEVAQLVPSSVSEQEDNQSEELLIAENDDTQGMSEELEEFGVVQESNPVTTRQIALEELRRQLDEIAGKAQQLSARLEELRKIEEEELKKKEKNPETAVCPVNINIASFQELQAITGIGPVISQRIIEARPFRSLNDLETRVKGVGPVTLQEIINQGCAYVEGAVGSDTSNAGLNSSPTYLKILISEIQISLLQDRFIELYNPNNSAVNLTDWYIQRRTETGTSWSSFISSTRFEKKVIPPKSYLLIASSSEADIFLSFTLTENNAIRLRSPDQETVDMVGWGSQAPDFETAPAENPPTGKSIGRKWSAAHENYIDTDNNKEDFDIQTPAPKIENQLFAEKEPISPLAVVINEIAWMGAATSWNDEWIELHNTTKSEIDLTGWKLVSVNNGSPDIALSGVISPLGFYLLERTDDSTINDIEADQIYTGALKNNPDCEILALYDQNNNEIDKTICLESGDWPSGDNSTKQTMERINPRTSGEDPANWASNNQIIRNGLDAGGSPISGTPRAQNSVYQTLPPDAILDLAIDSQNSYSNKITLYWSTSTDADTLSENLYYFIYYSKTETDLDSTSTVYATSSSSTITFSNLDYNSIYYFSIRGYDDQNYSLLSNVISHKTATLSIIAGGFSYNLSVDNNGRKLVRASSGVLYTIYRKESSSKIFLMSSFDDGVSWNETPVTPEENSDQINPSIAIDSQDNLHIAWQGMVGTSTVYKIRYTKYDGMSFSAIEDFVGHEDKNQDMPVIVVDSEDNIHLAWINKDNPGDIIYYQIASGGIWGNAEIVKNYEVNAGYYSSITHIALTVDRENNPHFVWFESLPSISGSSPHLRYLKRADGEIKNLATTALQNYSSISADLQNNLHIVWHQPTQVSKEWYSRIKYLKCAPECSPTDIEILDEEKNSQVAASPSVAVSSEGDLYIVWKRHDPVQQKPLSQVGYQNDNWHSVKNLIFPFEWQGFPNLLSQTKQPKAGYAFVFYEGTELKFYSSEDLIWE